MLWRSIFDQSFGLANLIITNMGFQKITWLSLESPSLFNSGITKSLNINLGFFCAIAAEVWQWTPFIAVLIGVSLKSIPTELSEWFKVKKLSLLNISRSLYIPYFKNILIVVFIIRFIDCFKTYEILWTFFGNSIDTASISIRIATYVLEVRSYSYGASLSILLFLLVFIMLFISFFSYRNKLKPYLNQWQETKY
jgi:multiple sugar transport system permease protein